MIIFYRVAAANEPSYKPAAEPDTPAYEPTDTAPADTPVNIPDSTPAEEPADNTPAPAEPAAHEHDWVPTYCYIEWLETEKLSETSSVSYFRQGGRMIDHYDCECGATKDGENKERINYLLSTKDTSTGTVVYFTDYDKFYQEDVKSLPSQKVNQDCVLLPRVGD